MELFMRKHALEQARERGVGMNEIKETIQRGAKSIQDEGKTVSIYRHIKIIFRKEEDKYFIITVMIRKEENGK